MTSLSDIYTWCSIVPGSFIDFPVKSGSNKDTVIVTNGQHLICVVQVGDQQTIKSWSAKQLFSFTCPAVFNPIRKEYCVVQNDYLLRQWTDDSETLMNSPKTKFTEKIYSLLDFDFLEPIVVFLKGDCQTLSKAIQSKKDFKHNYVRGDNLCWAAGYCDDTSYYVVFITKNMQSRKRMVHWLKITKSIGTVCKHEGRTLQRDQALPLSYCLQKNGVKSSLCVLWSDGELHLYKYNESTSKKILDLKHLTENSRAAICCLNNSYIAIVTCPRKGNISKSVLEIWDVNFSVKKETKNLSFLNEAVQIDYVSGVLFLSNIKELKGIYCNIQPSSLASVVGSATHSTKGSNEKESSVIRWTSQEMKNSIEDADMECKKLSDLLEMESTRQTLPRLCEQLFSKLCEKSDVSTLANALENWNHIPEKELAMTLQFCLSAKNEVFEELSVPEINDAEVQNCPFSHHKALFINKLLSLPFNDVFIQKHLQSIPFQHIMALLQYLLCLLKEKTESLNKWPSVQRICSWLCVLIDVHFSNFILSKDEKIHQLFLDLTDETKNMLQLYEDLDTLEELLIFAREKLHSSKSRQPSLYCIETLCM